MKKAILLLACLTLSFITYAQDWEYEKVDYKKIEKNIKKKKSNLFYPTLMKRYQAYDSTMTLEEKRHLYYGYSYQSAYSPYLRPPYLDSLNTVMSKQEHSTEDLNQIIVYADSVLAQTPFDIQTIEFRAYAQAEKGDKKKAKETVVQARCIIDALMSSGNGVSTDSPFYVISTSHEYYLVSFFGFRFGGEQNLMSECLCDYLKLAENDSNLEGLYFEVSACFRANEKLFKK